MYLYINNLHLLCGVKRAAVGASMSFPGGKGALVSISLYTTYKVSIQNIHVVILKNIC